MIRFAELEHSEIGYVSPSLGLDSSIAVENRRPRLDAIVSSSSRSPLKRGTRTPPRFFLSNRNEGDRNEYPSLIDCRRRKGLSVVVLLVATATWVVLELYQFNFIPVASWLAMSALTAAFIWGNILRLFGKEAPTPSMSGVEISEETVMEMANSIREWCEEGVRWMFRVGAEKEWFVFAKTVAALWLLSVVGTFTDLITFLCIGTVLGMTVPVLYAKYEYKIREYWERLREKCKRFYMVIDEKVLRKIKDRMVGHDQIKQHKME